MDNKKRGELLEQEVNQIISHLDKRKYRLSTRGMRKLSKGIVNRTLELEKLKVTN